MRSLTSISVTFLLAAIVSVIAKSAAYVQEIDIDIVPKENTDDSGVGGRRDVDDEVRPYQMPARRRRMLTAFDRHAVVDTLNRLRRSLGAPDMYYATWDRELEKRAADLTSGCQLQTSAQTSLSATFARGLTGYTRPSGVADEIQKIYFQGSNSTLYWQIMSSHLVYVGCAVGVRPCHVGMPHQPPGHVFTCLFSYSRPVTMHKPRSSTSSLPLCSQCDKDALWCDAGLCRIACRRGDVECVRSDAYQCEHTCSRCDRAVGGSQCQCVCYYANDQRRCTGDAEYATKNRPICRAAKSGLETPAGFLSLTVCVLLAFILIFIFVVCCVWRCRSRKRRQRQSAGATRRSEPDDGSTPGDFTTSAFVVSQPIVLTPPPYVEVDGTDPSPPPYYPYQSSSVGHGTQLCSVADLPSPVSVEPTAPPAANDDPTSSSGELPGVSRMAAYHNAAFSDSGV